MDVTTFHDEIRTHVGSARVEELSAETLRLVLPSSRMPFDSVIVGIERHGETWRITDAGQLSGLLGDDFADLIAALQCSGAPFEVEGSELFAEVNTRSVVRTALSFAHYLEAAPTTWHAMQCREAAKKVSTQNPSTGTQHMAGALLVRARRWVKPEHRVFLRTRSVVSYRSTHVRAPFAVRANDRQLPTLLATFVDHRSSGQSVGRAQATTSYMLDVIKGSSVDAVLSVRPGDDDESSLEHYSDFYEGRGISVISYDDTAKLKEKVLVAASRAAA